MLTFTKSTKELYRLLSGDHFVANNENGCLTLQNKEIHRYTGEADTFYFSLTPSATKAARTYVRDRMSMGSMDVSIDKDALILDRARFGCERRGPLNEGSVRFVMDVDGISPLVVKKSRTPGFYRIFSAEGVMTLSENGCSILDDLIKENGKATVLSDPECGAAVVQKQEILSFIY